MVTAQLPKVPEFPMHELPYPNENQDNIIASKYVPQKGGYVLNLPLTQVASYT